jgi:hypothetical protein
MAKRKPRQPRAKARHTRRAATAKNPSSFQVVPYKSARGQSFPLAYNVETLHADLTPQTSAFGVVAEYAVTPKNTKVYLPARS